MQMGQASVDSPLGKQILKLFCILPEVDFVCLRARNIFLGAPSLSNQIWHFISEVPFGDEVRYHCTNGMKSATNFSFDFQVAKCVQGTSWAAPTTAWESCTPTNWCPAPPPESEQNYTVVAHSTGNKFGDLCLGWDQAGEGDAVAAATCNAGTIVELRYVLNTICNYLHKA